MIKTKKNSLTETNFTLGRKTMEINI